MRDFSACFSCKNELINIKLVCFMCDFSSSSCRPCMRETVQFHFKFCFWEIRRWNLELRLGLLIGIACILTNHSTIQKANWFFILSRKHFWGLSKLDIFSSPIASTYIRHIYQNNVSLITDALVIRHVYDEVQYSMTIYISSSPFSYGWNLTKPYFTEHAKLPTRRVPYVSKHMLEKTRVSNHPYRLVSIRRASLNVMSRSFCAVFLNEMAACSGWRARPTCTALQIHSMGLVGSRN